METRYTQENLKIVIIIQKDMEFALFRYSIGKMKIYPLFDQLFDPLCPFSS